MGNIIRLKSELNKEFINKVLIRVVEQEYDTGKPTLNKYRKRIINIAVEFSNGYKTSLYVPNRPDEKTIENFENANNEESEEEKENRRLEEQKEEENERTEAKKKAELETKVDVYGAPISFVSEENPFKVVDLYQLYLNKEGNNVFDSNPYKSGSVNNVYTVVLNAPNGFDEFKLGGHLCNNAENNFKFKVFDDIHRIGLFKNNSLIAEYIGERNLTQPMEYTSNFPKSINNSLVNGFLVSAMTFQIIKVYYDDPQFDGGWGEWTDKKECAVTYDGSYTKEQTRMCNNPLPQYSGQECELDMYLYHEPWLKSNNFNSRTITCTPIDGGWSDWITSTECKKQTDGAYKKTRTRTCNNPEPKYGGRNCVGDNTDLISCNNPIDGGWSDWITSTECKKQTDGAYKKTRTRTCNNPEPKYGGSNCVGDKTILITCKPMNNAFNFEKIASDKMLIFRFLLLIIVILVIVNRNNLNPPTAKNFIPAAI